MHRLILTGLNHTTAPLEVREKLAMPRELVGTALAAFHARYNAAEAVLLSTCNRVELYVARATAEQIKLEEMGGFLADFRGLPPQSLLPHLYHKADRSVVEHLFTVACSLDSMVLGETQILGQVREAYDLARAAGTAGSVLNPLFQRATAVGKDVLSQTVLAEGRVSVASVAIDYAKRIFDNFADKTVLSIGAGEMSRLMLNHLRELKPGKLLICNRDGDKAAELAALHHGVAVPLENLPDHLVAADIVVSCTGATEPIITRKMFDGIMRRRRYRPMFLIDIAVPRDIDPDLGKLDNVYVYNVDDLQQVVASSRQTRQGAVDAAAVIVRQHVDEYVQWQQARQVGPMIHQLYRQYHAIADEEVARTIGKLANVSDTDQRILADMARRIVNKLLHHPVQKLRESDALRASTANHIAAMQSLFNLEPGDESADNQSTPNEDKPA